jgi:hypothetical protein
MSVKIQNSLEESPCRRKLPNITGRHQTTAWTPPGTTGDAAKHHEARHHEKAAHHAHTASGHELHSRMHAEEATKAHAEEHGKK